MSGKRYRRPHRYRYLRAVRSPCGLLDTRRRVWPLGLCRRELSTAIRGARLRSGTGPLGALLSIRGQGETRENKNDSQKFLVSNCESCGACGHHQLLASHKNSPENVHQNTKGAGERGGTAPSQLPGAEGAREREVVTPCQLPLVVQLDHPTLIATSTRQSDSLVSHAILPVFLIPPRSRTAACVEVQLLGGIEKAGKIG